MEPDHESNVLLYFDDVLIFSEYKSSYLETIEHHFDIIEKLLDFEALLVMRERTPITKNLIDNGAKEIILLGQNVNAWFGKGLDESDWTFARLIRELSKLEIERIRYITSQTFRQVKLYT